jgi:hypothetical protein
LNNPELNAAARQYLQLSTHWANLAENALPSSIPVFVLVKNLLNKKYLAYRRSNTKAYKSTHKELKKRITRLQTKFPMDNHETNLLYKKLSTQIKLIAELEMNAAVYLRKTIER